MSSFKRAKVKPVLSVTGPQITVAPLSLALAMAFSTSSTKV
ncbi:hypothetical protein [Companilactobacillus zhongbaensis]|nr:hypothetical protein [Companilactobacillus zhongbaensis]